MKKSVLMATMLMLSITLVFSAAQREVVQDDTKPYAGVTLHVIAEQQNPTLALEKQLADFEEQTGIQVELEMGPMDNVVGKEMLAMESKSGAYDVISIPYQFLGQLVVNDYIQSIDPFFDREDLKLDNFDQKDLIAGMVAASGEWKGVNYGIPSNTCIMVMFYREDLFGNPEEKAAFKAKYGYDLAPPENWDQYRDCAEFFTRKAGDRLAGQKLTQDFYGTSIAGKRHDAMTCEWLNYAWSFGGGVFDESGNLIINSAENRAALDYFVNLVEFCPPGVSNNTWDELTTQMQQGIVAMQIQWNDCAPSVEDPSSSKVAGKVGYTTIPVKVNPVAHYGAWTYFIPADAPNPEAAWIFLQWVNTSEVQKKIALEGGFPTLSSVFNDPELVEKLPYWQASLDAYEISSRRPRIPQWNEMNNAMMLELSHVIAGNKNSATALRDLESVYKKLLAGELPVDYQ